MRDNSSPSKLENNDEYIISDSRLEKMERETYKHSFFIKHIENLEHEEHKAKTERKSVLPKSLMNNDLSSV